MPKSKQVKRIEALERIEIQLHQLLPYGPLSEQVINKMREMNYLRSKMGLGYLSYNQFAEMIETEGSEAGNDPT